MCHCPTFPNTVGIKVTDIKLLWARAAGRCSHPSCGIDLTPHLELTGNIVLGEMAHAIARSDIGPRGGTCAGSNSYENLVLLCPTHHTLVDKAPMDHAVKTLIQWKLDHERRVASSLDRPVPPVLWHVPIRAPVVLVGRNDELVAIEERVADHLVVITGPGGIGKSALAAHWAATHRASLDVAWWMRADAEVDLEAGLEQLGTALQISAKHGYEELLSWLRKNTSWALILDNARGPELMTPLQGVLENGVVIVTSKNPNWRPHADPVQLGPLTESESLELLQSRAGRVTGEVTELAADLGGLPLALIQAGSFIQATGTSVPRYRQLLASRFGELMEVGTGDDHPAGVWATWHEAFAAARSENSLVGPLIQTLSFLAPDPVPALVFSGQGHGHDHTPVDSVNELMADELRFAEVVAVARRYSLVEASADMLSMMHDVFQRIARDSLGETERDEYILAAVSVVYHALPEDATGYEVHPAALILLPHALSALGHAIDARLAHPVLVRLIIEVGRFLQYLWALEDARSLLEFGMAVAEVLGEPEPRATLILTALYADVLSKLGLYEQALPVADRATALAREQGDLHEEASALARRGWLASEMGQLEEGSKYLEAALKLDGELHGENSTLYAAHLNNLGIIRERQGRLLESYELQKRALDISIELGEYGREAAVQLGNLAASAASLGRVREALHLATQALRRMEELFSSPNHDIALSRMKLGMAEMDLGRPEVAARIFLQARSELIGVLGTNVHPEVAALTHRLGLAYKRAGARTAALKEYEAALEMRLQLLGPDHPDVAETHNNFAVLYEDMRDKRRALEHYAKAAEIYQKQRSGDAKLLRHIRTKVKLLEAALKPRNK